MHSQSLFGHFRCLMFSEFPFGILKLWRNFVTPCVLEPQNFSHKRVIQKCKLKFKFYIRNFISCEVYNISYKFSYFLMHRKQVMQLFINFMFFLVLLIKFHLCRYLPKVPNSNNVSMVKYHKRQLLWKPVTFLCPVNIPISRTWTVWLY